MWVFFAGVGATKLIKYYETSDSSGGVFFSSIQFFERFGSALSHPQQLQYIKRFACHKRFGMRSPYNFTNG